MRQIMKSLSYTLLISLLTWFAAGFARVFTEAVRFTAADKAPGDLTSLEEWVVLLVYIATVGSIQWIVLKTFRSSGKTRLYPVILYGVPITAILIFSILTFRITVGE